MDTIIRRKKVRTASAKKPKTAGALTAKKAVTPRVGNCGGGCCRMIRLGRYHGYTANIYKRKSDGHVHLEVGCRSFDAPTEARRHWSGGKNPDGDPRPQARQLIATAIQSVKAVGWKWGA